MAMDQLELAPPPFQATAHRKRPRRVEPQLQVDLGAAVDVFEQPIPGVGPRLRVPLPPAREAVAGEGGGDRGLCGGGGGGLGGKGEGKGKRNGGEEGRG